MLRFLVIILSLVCSTTAVAQSPMSTKYDSRVAEILKVMDIEKAIAAVEHLRDFAIKNKASDNISDDDYIESTNLDMALEIILIQPHYNIDNCFTKKTSLFSNFGIREEDEINGDIPISIERTLTLLDHICDLR